MATLMMEAPVALPRVMVTPIESESTLWTDTVAGATHAMRQLVADVDLAAISRHMAAGILAALR